MTKIGTVNRHVFVDMDGVLADFDKGFRSLFNLDHKAIEEDEMWRIASSHPDFFDAFDPMPGAVAFFRQLEMLHTQGRIAAAPTILTAAPRLFYERASEQKRTWAGRHLGTHIRIITVKGGRTKPLHMTAAGDILIDDLPRNIDAWEAAGGRGVQFVDPSQAFTSLQTLLQQH